MFSGAVRQVRFFVDLLGRQGHLLLVLAGREVADRFSGSLLGKVWALAHPLFIVGLFVFVFTFIFGMRFASADTGLDYIVFFISGYLPWMVFQEVSNKSCTAITGNGNLVKQVVFPLEVLPLKHVLAALVPQAIGLAFLLIYTLLKTGGVPWTYVLLPVAVALQVIGLFGIALLLAAVATFLRDVKEVMAMHAMAGLYLLPILYVPTAVPPVINRLLWFNPLSHPIWVFKDVLFHGTIAHPWSWLITAAGAAILFVAGLALFRKVKVYFGNVL